MPQLSFAEAAELAYFGAKVLHPSTILPAVERNIPVRILNSRKPDAAGTLITGAGPPPDRTPLTALACKRDVTVVDITSSRMLMAYGFLRRVFEVFERFTTAVDVVTTSEVSVSVTVDDRRHLEAIVEALSEFSQVSVEQEMALLCAVGDRLRNEPEIAARVVGVLEEVPLRMISQAASRRNITVILRQADLPHAMERLHEEFFGMSMKAAASSATARWDGWSRSWPSRRASRSSARIDVGQRRVGAPADVAIDFSTASRCSGQLSRSTSSGSCRPSSARPAGPTMRPAFRQQAEHAGLGVVASANFSIGVNVFELIVAEAAQTDAAAAAIRRLDSRDRITPPSATRPSGTALLLRDAMAAAGFDRPIDMSSTRAGTIPGTHTVGFDGASDTIELTHTCARSPRLCERARCSPRNGSRASAAGFPCRRART